MQDAAAAIVDDSFLRCFQSQSTDPWNWNIYLAPLWAVGVVVRYLILFPLRHDDLPYAMWIVTLPGKFVECMSKALFTCLN